MLLFWQPITHNVYRESTRRRWSRRLRARECWLWLRTPPTSWGPRTRLTSSVRSETWRLIMVFCAWSTEASALRLWLVHADISLALQTKYKQTAEMDRASYTTVIDTPDIIHAQQMKNIVSQVIKRSQLAGVEIKTSFVSSSSVSTAGCICIQQKKYKEEAEKTMSHYVPVLDTPEMQRVRENQRNFSTVSDEREWIKCTGATRLWPSS